MHFLFLQKNETDKIKGYVIKLVKNSMKQISAETERLFIRQITQYDYEDIIEYGTDDETGQYMIYWPKTKEQIKEFVLNAIGIMKDENPSVYELVLVLKSAQKVIGNVSIKKEDGISEIGWISNKRYWNKGLMTEGLSEILLLLKKETDVKKIYATCTEKNIGSYRLMEKMGMKRIEKEENKESIKDGKKVSYTKLRYELDLNEKIV